EHDNNDDDGHHRESESEEKSSGDDRHNEELQNIISSWLAKKAARQESKQNESDHTNLERPTKRRRFAEHPTNECDLEMEQPEHHWMERSDVKAEREKKLDENDKRESKNDALAAFIEDTDESQANKQSEMDVNVDTQLNWRLEPESESESEPEPEPSNDTERDTFERKKIQQIIEKRATENEANQQRATFAIEQMMEEHSSVKEELTKAEQEFLEYDTTEEKANPPSLLSIGHTKGSLQDRDTFAGLRERRVLFPTQTNEPSLFQRDPIKRNKSAFDHNDVLPSRAHNAKHFSKQVKVEKKMQSRDVVPLNLESKLFSGHRSVDTVKECNFLGPRSEYVASGSDCGHVFIWRKSDGEIVNILQGDENITNVVQGNPVTCSLVTSGLDDTVKFFIPTADEPNEMKEKDDIIRKNQNSQQQLTISWRYMLREDLFRIMNSSDEENFLVPYSMEIATTETETEDEHEQKSDVEQRHSPEEEEEEEEAPDEQKEQ
ncbi:hypothetical protein RFI_13018, partial [Reticulomyxa filosa]